MKLTNWFPAETEPVRKGYYDTDVKRDACNRMIVTRCYWEDGHWYLTKNYRLCVCKSVTKWRGRLKNG